jgi:ribose transport system permease protein
LGHYPHQSLAIPVGIAAGLTTAVCWGTLNGVIITRLHVPPLIVTLGTMGMALGGANLLTGGVSVPNVPPELQTAVGAYNIDGWLPVPVLIAAVFVAICYRLLHKTRFGRYTYAIGSNLEASRRVGIKVNRHRIKVYALAGLLAGIAGVIDLARFDTITPSSHALDNLNAIAAAAIGGTSLFGGVGTILGGVIGAFIPTVLQNGLVIQNVDPYWQQVLVGGIIIAAVYIDQWRRRRML